MKRIVLIIVLILVLIIFGIFIVKNVTNNNHTTDIPKNDIENTENNVKIIGNNEKENISKSLNKTKTFEGFQVSNIHFTEKDGQDLFVADVTNVSKQNIEGYTFFKITFLNKNGGEIVTIPGMINPVKQNETVPLNATITGDLNNYINAFDFVMTVDKR